MKKANKKERLYTIIAVIYCFLGGHKYTLKRDILPYIRELKCDRCKKEFGMNDETNQILPLDQSLSKAHDMMKENKKT